MATKPQRAQSLGDALLNGVASTAQINRLALALAFTEGKAAAFNAMTQAERAAYFVDHLKTYCTNATKGYDVSTATATAAATALAANAQEFPPEP